jgi:anti-anti-sigma factor
MVDACDRGASELVLDLSGIEFVDSEGFRVLLGGRALCEEHLCTFCLIPAQTGVQRVLELTRIIDRLPFRKRRRSKRASDAAATDS